MLVTEYARHRHHNRVGRDLDAEEEYVLSVVGAIPIPPELKIVTMMDAEISYPNGTRADDPMIHVTITANTERGPISWQAAILRTAVRDDPSQARRILTDRLQNALEHSITQAEARKRTEPRPK